MSQVIPLTSETVPAKEVFDKQYAAYLKSPYMSYEERIANLDKLDGMLRENIDAIAAAIDKDYGGRSVNETRMLELFPSLDGIKYVKKRLKKWMKPQNRHVAVWFLGAKNSVLPQPKGVVGVIVPWNYPLFLGISPITTAMAAGNRVMVKMARNSQNLCRLLNELAREKIGDDILTFLPGVSAADFTPLPFNHLIFTGSPESGKVVMRTAADNLTPVTLELGGKSPTIICDDFDIETAAKRITYTKFLNAGQTCVAPDYIFVPRGKVEEFIAHAKKSVTTRYPQLSTEDFTSVVDRKSYERLSHWLDDASSKGANVEPLIAGAVSDAELQKIPPTIVSNVSDDMLIMQEEIFGPLLPIMPYDKLDDVLDFVIQRENPLALYLFTNDANIQDRVIKNTLSGGVCLNDSLFHVAQHDMPFGGVGNSGMGHYHAYEGFLEFSKLRPIFRQARFPLNRDLEPPYGNKFNTIYNLILRFTK